jgi:dTDP-4-amino-4,6-dideoxygalactose transaminase
MLEMQAAIGRIQLKRMKDWTAARTANAMALREAMLPFAGGGGGEGAGVSVCVLPVIASRRRRRGNPP